MTTLGVVSYGPRPFEVEMRPTTPPPLGRDDVLVEVEAVGVCGSDVHMWTGDNTFEVSYPVVLGHEFVGVIVEVGAGVDGWAVGQRIVSETAADVNMHSCLSRQGLYNLDPDRRGFGGAVDGAMTKLVRVPARLLHTVPDTLPLDVAALTEPCCVAYNAVINNGDPIRPGDRVVVIGPGPIGILSAAIARLSGAEVAIVGLERDEPRLAVAREMGIHTIVGDATAWAFEVDGLGADGVVDASGVSQTVAIALDLVRPAGWISKVGWGTGEFGCSLDPLVKKNVTLRGSFSHNWPVWERVIRLLDTGTLDVRPLIGGVWPLDEWETAFRSMHDGLIVKAVLHP